MKYLFLFILGLTASYFAPFVLTAVSLPGRFVAFPPKFEDQNSKRFLLGVIITIVAQSSAYLTYATLILNWVKHNAGITNFLVALLLIEIPISRVLYEFNLFVKEIGAACIGMEPVAKKKIGEPKLKMFKMLAQAAFITFCLTFIEVLIFVFY